MEQDLGERAIRALHDYGIWLWDRQLLRKEKGQSAIGSRSHSFYLTDRPEKESRPKKCTFNINAVLANGDTTLRWYNAKLREWGSQGKLNRFGNLNVDPYCQPDRSFKHYRKANPQIYGRKKLSPNG